MGDTGKVDQIKGDVRKAYGDMTGNREQQRKGSVDRAAGKVKEAVEFARRRLHDFIEGRDKAHH